MPISSTPLLGRLRNAVLAEVRRVVPKAPDLLKWRADGRYGSLSRLLSWFCGSAINFTIGSAASSPGQVPVEDVHTVVEILKKSLTPKI